VAVLSPRDGCAGVAPDGATGTPPPDLPAPAAPAPGAATPFAARFTSPAVIAPPGPLPGIDSRATPSCFARLRTAGVACPRAPAPAPAPAAECDARAAAPRA